MKKLLALLSTTLIALLTCVFVSSATSDYCPNGHLIYTVKIEPTCDTEGYTLLYCECGELAKINIIPANGHKMEYNFTVLPTCTTKGEYDSRKCITCGLVVNGKGDYGVLPHDFEITCIEQPICTENGVIHKKCKACNETFDEVAPAKPHSWGDWVTICIPTCTTDGLKRLSCIQCSTVEEVIVPALGHNDGIGDGKMPTCTEEGYTPEFTCIRCGCCTTPSKPLSPYGHKDEDNDGKCERCYDWINTAVENNLEYVIINGEARIIGFEPIVNGEVYLPATLGGYPVTAIEYNVFDTDVPYFKGFEVENNNNYFSSDEYGVLYNKDKTELLCYPSGSKNDKYSVPETVVTINVLHSFYLETLIIPDNVKVIEDICSLSFKDVYIYGNDTEINPQSALCWSWVDPEKWFEIRDEYTELCEEYVAKMINGTLNEEESNIFNNKLREFEDYFWLENPAACGTIHSYDPSTAKTYAEENGIKFEEITDIPTSGTCGNNSTWSFDAETGKLVISGSGTAGLERDDNGNYIIPWESLKLNIKSLVVENGIEGIGGFENCVNLKVVTLADSIIVFGDEAFRNCSSLEEIKLPQSLTMIGAAAFCDCTSLKEVVIPDTVEYIYPGAFVKCFNLESVKLPSYLTCIEDDVFNYCYKLKHLEIPETVTKIDGNPFVCCVSLKEISIPAGVTTIEPAAFENCWALEDIYIYSEQLGLDNSLLGEISAYKGIEEYYGSTNKDQNITSYINVSLKYLSGDADVQETIEGIVDCIQKYEKPIYSETLTIHGYAGSNAETYANKNGIKFEIISENTTIADSNTGVEIEYDNSAFECEVELVVSEEEINANIVFGDEFESYKAYDISLEADGEKVQPKGYVTVKLPIPEGFNADSTVVYYVDDSGNKTKLESTTENGYIVFETNHFSEYVLVDESSRIEPPHVHSYTASITKEATCTENGTTTYICSCGDSYNETIEATGHDFDGSKCKNCDYDKADTCGCNCHKGGFMGFIWKIINFFNKLFKSKQYCACGVKHY